MNNIFSNIWFLYNWISFKRKVQLLFIVGFSIFVSIMEIVMVAHWIDTLKEYDQVFEVHKDIIKKVNI